MDNKEYIFSNVNTLYDNELEKTILGTMMSYNTDTISKYITQLSEKSFYNTKHATLFKAMRDEVNNNKEPTRFSIAYSLLNKVVGMTPLELSDIIDHVLVSETSMQEHINILIGYEQRRAMKQIADDLYANGIQSDEKGKYIANLQSKLTQITLRTGRKVYTMQNVIKEIQSMVDDNINGTRPSTSTKTGFPFIDAKGGLQGTDLVIIAGCSSQGKTAFADSIMHHAIMTGDKVACYSLEMTDKQLTARMLSTLTKIQSNRLLNSRLSAEEQKVFDTEIGKCWNYSENLFFEDSSTQSIDNILTSIRKLREEHNIKGAVVDYLQLVSGRRASQSREEFIAECARRFKNLAKELNIWIIVLSQLNRNSDQDTPLPTSERLRDSGQILEASDLCLLIYRPEYYNQTQGKNLSYPAPYQNIATEGTAMVIVAKGRNVGIGNFICAFDANTTTFSALSVYPNKSDVRLNNQNLPY